MKKKKKYKKNPGGRPTDYRPEYCELLIKHLEQGLSIESFGAIVNVSKETIYTWFEKHPKFLDAKKKGLVKSRLWWEKCGHKGMWSGKQFNAAVYIFNMRNRFGWHDQQGQNEEDTFSPLVFIKKKNDSN